ncbi:MAG TPA: response regulator [Rectinemataceae bacterium]|nr:response regulator [Rectinemataceae bacterium]
MKILIVDDDPVAGEISQAILEAGGYDTLLAEGAAAARELISRDADIALVVSDHRMPEKSGIDLHKELAAAGSKLPFILLSADDPVKLRELAPGLDAALAKDEALTIALPAAAARLIGKGMGGEP